MDAMIRTRGLTRRFEASPEPAVEDLNLDIARREIFGLVGPDGAGKSTALRLICGLLTPTSGEAFIDGHPAARLGPLRESIGYLAQRFGFYQDLSVEENMEFYADLYGLPSSERPRFFEHLLEMTRLIRFRTRPAGQLSGGMKQKLALICTLLHQPRVLVLDEPTNGLDPVSRRDLWFLLYQLVKDGMTVLISTAYLDEAEHCHRVALMNRGRVLACGEPGVLRRSVPSQCYEIRVIDRQRGRAVLSRCVGVKGVELCGAALHLFLDPALTSPAVLTGALREAGEPEPAFSPILPTLEDVLIVRIRAAEKPAPDAV